MGRGNRPQTTKASNWQILLEYPYEFGYLVSILIHSKSAFSYSKLRNKIRYTCLHVNCPVVHRTKTGCVLLSPGSAMLWTGDCLDITPGGPKSFCLDSSAVRARQTTTYPPSLSSLAAMTAHWKVPVRNTEYIHSRLNARMSWTLPQIYFILLFFLNISVSFFCWLNCYESAMYNMLLCVLQTKTPNSTFLWKSIPKTWRRSPDCWCQLESLQTEWSSSLLHPSTSRPGRKSAS